MVACPACGKEMPADMKFCEECGAALSHPKDAPGKGTAESAPVPRGDRTQTPVPQDPGKGKSRALPVKMIGGVIAVVLILAVVGLYGLPLLKGAGQPVSGPNTAALVPPTLPAAARPAAVAYATPATATLAPAVIEVIDERSGMTYIQVYRNRQDFTTGQSAVFTANVQKPPLVIRFTLEPQLIAHDKIINHGLSTERTVTENIPDPLSFFEIDVVNAATGTVIERQGFNKDFGTETKQEFMVRSGGDLRVEMTGTRVNADVQILTGKP